MKKCLIIMLLTIMFITGCGKVTKDKVIGDFTKAVDGSKSYKLNGTMEINNGDDLFTYSIEVNYLKDDYYKVILVNQTNNHEQVILKNPEGLYVITPSLNKSFKFDSVWPENSSQSYLLQNLVNDIKNDNNAGFEETDNGYIIKTTVNYPNNEDLNYQKIYFDKDMNVNKVEVYNKDNTIEIKVVFKSINMRAKLKEDDFELKKLINDNNTNSSQNSNNESELKTGLTLDNIVYPLYIPTNTHLNGNETMDTDSGSRVILTFGGDKNFVLVEENAIVSDEFEIIPVFGDPLIINDSIGAISSNSISWNKDNISYYLVSSDLSNSEMISVAKSLSGTKSVMSNK